MSTKVKGTLDCSVNFGMQGDETEIEIVETASGVSTTLAYNGASYSVIGAFQLGVPQCSFFVTAMKKLENPACKIRASLR